MRLGPYPCLQPILKADLEDFLGKPLLANRMEQIEAQLFRFLDTL